MLGLGLFLLKPDSGLDESDCRSATFRTFLLEHTVSILSASSNEKQVQPGAEPDSQIFVQPHLRTFTSGLIIWTYLDLADKEVNKVIKKNKK